MSRVQRYLRSAIYLLMICLPPSWTLRMIMQIARLRSALGPEANWPAEVVGWAISDRKAAWRRRMFVWAQEVWLLTSGPRLGATGVCRHLSVVGIEHVREAVESGDGAIVILTHQMGLYAIGWPLVAAGLPSCLLAYVPDRRPSWVDRWWTSHSLQIRAFGAHTLLNVDGAGIRQAYRRLQKGELVFMMQDLPGDRYRVRLLQSDTSLALGSVRMAMATGARLIPCTVVPLEDGGLQVCFRPRIEAAGGEAELAEAVTRAVEDLILSGPELWRPEFVYPELAGNGGRVNSSTDA